MIFMFRPSAERVLFCEEAVGSFPKERALFFHALLQGCGEFIDASRLQMDERDILGFCFMERLCTGISQIGGIPLPQQDPIG